MNINDVTPYITKEELDQTFERAHELSKKSVCQRKGVGAVLYDPMSMDIVGEGIGGPVTVCETCTRDVHEWRQDGCWSIHSEPRAIIDCLNRFGKSPQNVDMSEMIMIVTHGPCDQCLKYMEFFGITTCIFDIPYHDNWIKWEGRVDVYSRETVNELL